MTDTQQVIERAMTFVAVSKALRQREQERLAAWKRRVDISRPLPPLPRAVQLSLKLDR
ncbi:hypothetical protein MOV66_17200 [Agrobacterium sp. SHOUNA12C]|uniref:Uncharacterized protein n=1 Tax=Rhizobium rhizogenes (strain K84 / ATCC BAA-868) TaxID=311403 RepID=B9JJ16_RHIR8|nr:MULTISPECIES: hypothetical protein [Rhizobium]ACM29908.1 hypothetical protein Arad_8701 [Rhizobium rhizogenes K84]MCJ9723012.1 hypothetical protein [Agrobacterium sp. BETTINA12B]MCJ9758388.1 hypothetical protein [Agrobacterium sp. SHOUNA12C]EJK85442.1 hypothetical protein PMI03_02164 [Rhizobium sp. AP16]MDJ1635397.1 hypothetical protein [Rhizobium rhizogenes]